MPTKIAAVMPCFVVPRQNSSMTRAGRLAEAAMLNAQPTRKLTLSLWNRMPSTIAIRPTTTAVILPARTFGVIVHLDPQEVRHEVVSHRAAGRHDQPADRAQHRRERDRRNHRERQLAEAAGQERRGHVAVGHVQPAAGHRAQAQEQRQDVEEPDAGDAHDRALAGRGLVLDRVIANQNVRQRRRAAEQGDHQREEVELRSARTESASGCRAERRAAAGRQHFLAASFGFG